MMLIYVNFRCATIDCNSLSVQRMRIVTFSWCIGKGSNKKLCASNKSVAENSAQRKTRCSRNNNGKHWRSGKLRHSRNNNEKLGTGVGNKNLAQKKEG